MTTFPGSINGLNQIANPEVHASGLSFQNDATARNPVGGMIRRHDGLYRYVKFSTGTGTVTPSAGAPAYAKVFTPDGSATAVPVFTVTADQSDSVAGLQPVGVFLTQSVVLTDGNYCWIQVAGRGSTLAIGGVAGNVIIGSSTDNQFAIIADGSSITNVPVGRVCGASSGGLSPTILFNMDW
jgi:hypothetical protein